MLCCKTVGEQPERLVDEISRNTLQLSQDPFGSLLFEILGAWRRLLCAKKLSHWLKL
ncbi:hypothetical protein YC2023_094416 [Brassica napus]